MKFLHMADMHFDAPFVNLAEKGDEAKKRRMEQRKAMKDVVTYIKNNNIPYLFIAGDLYEQEYVKKTTIEYINNLFKEIPNTYIFITPGNHDPYLNNSFYKQFNWNNNVHIFTSELEIIETEEADIYGYGFNNFYMNSKYENIDIKNPNKVNILIAHGSLDSSVEGLQYNPISSKKLKESGFDYVALGHIHKASYNDYENQKIVYPGSTVSLGFDELGIRGVIVAEVTKTKRNIQFLGIKTKGFEEEEVNISEINSTEELIELINDIDTHNNFYKVILVGKRHFNIDTGEILRLIDNENIVKIKNHTTIKYDIEDIANQISLKGLFAKKILDKMENAKEEEKQKLLDAFEIGMDILK